MADPVACRLEDLLDVSKLQEFFDSLNAAFPFPSAIIDNESNILTTTACQDVCTQFHRAHPECEVECRESDRYILSHIDEADPSVVYQCPRGMVDAATPILVGGKHLGNAFVGQLFLEKPDLEFFRAQAAKYGFDEDAYLEAVDRAPVLTREQLERNLAVAKEFTEILGAMGLERLQELEATTAQRDSQTRYRTILDAIGDAVFVLDVETGAVLEVNRSACEMYGYSSAEFRLIDFATLGSGQPPCAPDDAREWMLRAAEEGPQLFEWRARDKSGRLFWIEQTMRHATIGGQERLLVTTNDITLRQQGEIALEDSERRYRKLFDSAGDAIFIHDTEGRMLAVNATACERLGYTRNELLAMNIDAVDAPGHGVHVPERLTRIIAQERIAFESVHRRKDGSLVPTELNAQLITWEGRPAVMSIARDITERQRMEEALVRSSRTQGILNDVFRLSLEDLDLTALLQRTIDQMLTIPWLELLPRGAIFLAEGRTLRLMAHRGLAKPLLRACASVDFGRCLCGRAALTGEFVFVDHLDERHETAYEGMAPHGHYCVPILSAGEVMGVVCLYLPPGHEAQPGEREVLEAVASALAGILRRRRAEEALLESAVALRRTVDGAVAAMGALVETRDPYTAGHERRVTELAVALGAEMGLGADTLETLRLASAVHDIGKVAVPAEILNRPGRLSETELALIKVHPAAGADILASVEFGAPVADVVRWHHERLDGSGYPDGLVGEAIPREARIIAVADVVEAMASHRPYRPALGIEAALAEIAEGAGRLYDADVAAACARVFAAGFAFSE